jgi:hypothetical protein
MKNEEIREEKFRRTLSKVRALVLSMEARTPEMQTPISVRMQAIEGLVHCDAIMSLLIVKGIITNDEIAVALQASAEEEVEMQRVALSEMLGHPVVIIEQ